MLVAAGNAPDDPGIKLEIARLMEQAQDPANALEIYRNLAERKPCPVEALEGAGRVAFALGRFQLARVYLEQVLSHRDFVSQPDAVQSSTRELLAATIQVLDLFPGAELPARERAKRVLHAAEVAKGRLQACSMSRPAPPPSLADLATKWQQVPDKLSPLALELDPQMEQMMMNLVFDTEKQTATACGSPGGEDALLLKIAQSPVGVEMQ